MRPSCLYCARKHLAKASILLSESRLGYPSHLWLAIGNMSEAEEEILAAYPKLAEDIRAHRKTLESNAEYMPPFMEWIEQISTIAEDPQVVSGEVSLQDNDDIFDVSPEEFVAATNAVADYIQSEDFNSPETIEKAVDRIQELTKSIEPVTLPTPPPTIEVTQESIEARHKSCSSCKEWEDLHKQEVQGKDRLILFTTFGGMDGSYSLANVVIEQIRAARLAGWGVSVWVLRNFNMATLPKDIAKDRGVIVRKIFPTWTWKEDEINFSIVPDINAIIDKTLNKESSYCDEKTKRMVIAHDIIFQSWFVTFAHALHQRPLDPDWTWFHIGHSTVGNNSDLNGDARARCMVPQGHHIISLNKAHVPLISQFYQIPYSRIHYMPNSKDFGYLNGHSDQTKDIVSKTGLDKAPIAMIYPFSATRTKAKGVYKLLLVWEDLVMAHPDAKLLLIDAHSTDKRAKEAKGEIGHPPGVEWISEYLPENKAYAGLPHETVMELFQYTNLFIFPSHAEACPLVLLEAMASGCLVYYNEDVDAMRNVIGDNGIPVKFGTSDVMPPMDYAALIDSIVSRLSSSQSNTAKRLLLSQYSAQVWGDALSDLYEGKLRVPVPAH